MDESVGISSATFSDKCIACNPNCRTCQIEPDRCTSCPDGTRLFSSRCAGMYTVVYQYELNNNYSDFLANSKSQDFVDVVASAVNVDSNDTYITYVREGSTVIGGSISTTSSSNANAVQSSLGSTLPGFTVLSSSASVYYGDSVYNAPPE